MADLVTMRQQITTGLVIRLRITTTDLVTILLTTTIDLVIMHPITIIGLIGLITVALPITTWHRLLPPPIIYPLMAAMVEIYPLMAITIYPATTTII